MPIGLGTAAIGRPQYINIKENVDPTPFHLDTFSKKGKTILTEAYKRGIRHFDTAPGYGIAEQLLIEWIKEYKPQDITVSTKWGYTYIADFNPSATTHEIKEHSLRKLNEQWETSKQLLPYLNIYQIHSATLDSGVLDNKQVLNRLFELKQKHNILIGLSTSGDSQNEIIRKALNIKINNECLFDSFQITYNIFDQSLLSINNVLQKLNKQIIIKEALANGRVFPNRNYLNYKKTYDTLNQLASKHQVGIDAIALRFCLDTIDPFMVLSGAIEDLHLKSNLKATSFQLTNEEVNKIKSLVIHPTDYWNERKALVWN